MLLTRGGLLAVQATPQGAQGAHLQLAVPGVTLPASHLVYIWAAVLASLVVHEVGCMGAGHTQGLPAWPNVCVACGWPCACVLCAVRRV